MKHIFYAMILISNISVYANITSQSVCKSTNEAIVYKKNKKVPKGISDRGKDVLAYLDLGKKTTAQKSSTSLCSSDNIYALSTVNGEPITNIDLINAIKIIFFSTGKTYDHNVARMIMPAVLESLEDNKLRMQCAKLFGIKITDQDINEEITRVASLNNLSSAELENKLRTAGISFDAFKQSIKSRFIFQMITQSLADTNSVSNREIIMAKKEQASLISSRRYFIIEIFRYDKDSAEKIRQLAFNGYDFSVLAEHFSQTIQTSKRGKPQCVKLSSLEQDVAKCVKTMNTNSLSNVIKTKNGYKIIYLIDIAEPGKEPSSRATYKVYKTTVHYKNSLYTKKDIKDIEIMLDKLSKTETVGDFKKICLINGLEAKEEILNNNDQYTLAILKQSKETGKPVVVQSKENEADLDVIMYIGETVGNATLPNDRQIIENITNKQIDDSFKRNYRKIKSMIHIERNKENIKRVMK